jgi:tripeptidyl-peptidase-1
MSLVKPQSVTSSRLAVTWKEELQHFLDARDASYCIFEGGDSKDPNVDNQYGDTLPGGFHRPKNCGGFASTYDISTRYSSNEADLSAEYEQGQCMEYMKLGLQGVSILLSDDDHMTRGIALTDSACYCLISRSLDH